MGTYIKKTDAIKASNFERTRYSFCPRDYRTFDMPKQDVSLLKDLLENDEVIGNEIRSDSYLDNSDYGYFKTTNIQDKYSLDASQVEKCMPTDLGRHPICNSIFIAKDGANDGLGEVCFYSSTDNSKDYISSGILDIKVKSKYQFYVLALLKNEHFREFIDLKTPEGSTIRHSKKISLEYPVILPDELKIERISNITKLILDKERCINIKHNEIDKIIKKELNENGKIVDKSVFVEDVIGNNYRLDAGMYGPIYKHYDELLVNYKNGYYCIPSKDIKSGNTPKARIINKEAKYTWVTPTDITDYGFLKKTNNISMQNNNNIKKDCILFINRTSKGGKGEYVGISMFYDTKYYGLGHHNQGIFRVDSYEKNELLFIVSYMNSTIMRLICGKTSYGTKMRELKQIDFCKFKIPNFPENIKKNVIKEYYCEENNFIENYLFDEEEKQHNMNIGIFQLEQEIIKLKRMLNKEINEIIAKAI